MASLARTLPPARLVRGPRPPVAAALDLLEDGPPDWYQRLGALAARHCCPTRWQALYDAQPDALAASVFLRARSPTITD